MKTATVPATTPEIGQSQDPSEETTPAPTPDTLASPHWDHLSLMAHARLFMGTDKSIQSLDSRVRACVANGTFPADVMIMHEPYIKRLKKLHIKIGRKTPIHLLSYKS